MDTKTKNKTLKTFYFIYGLCGLSFITIDPLIPVIAENIGVGFDKIGIALLIGSIFTLISMFLTGRLSDRMDIKKIQIFGLVLLFLGFTLFGFYLKYALFIIVLILIRIGFGTLDVALHSFSAKFFTKDVSRIFLNIDIGWFLGAALGPLLVSLFLFYGIFPRYLFFIFAFIYLLSVFIVFRICPNQKQLKKNLSEIGEDFRSKKPSLSSLKDPVVIVSGLLLFFKIGAIMGFSTWLTTYFLDLGIKVVFGSAILSAFWLFSVIGMVIAIRIVPRFSEVSILFYGNLLGTIFFSLFTFIPNIYIKIALLPFIAISFSGVFPLTTVIAAQRDQKSSGTILGFIMALTFASSMVYHPILGYVTEYLGKNKIVFIILIGMLIGLAFTFVLFKLMRWKRIRKSVRD